MNILSTVARRLLQLVGVMAGVAIVTFLLLRLAPGDPARLLAGERASAIDAFRKVLELNPRHEEALRFLLTR